MRRLYNRLQARRKSSAAENLRKTPESGRTRRKRFTCRPVRGSSATSLAVAFGNLRPRRGQPHPRLFRLRRNAVPPNPFASGQPGVDTLRDRRNLLAFGRSARNLPAHFRNAMKSSPRLRALQPLRLTDWRPGDSAPKSARTSKVGAVCASSPEEQANQE